jgi:DnaJ-class molecular chaperone
MSTIREYEDKHWKWIVRYEFDKKRLSRKSKKALRRHFDEMVQVYEQSDEFILYDLPECEICNGTGKDDPYDLDWFSSEDCSNCSGKGKIGWKYDESGKKQPIRRFLKNKTRKYRMK